MPAAEPKPARSANRERAAHLRPCRGMSERRACRVIHADRKSVRYRSVKNEDSGLRERLRDLANQWRRVGYRRLHFLLRWESVIINRKKTLRLYRQERLAVRRRRSRRRAVGIRAPAVVLANRRRTLDFVHDQMASGKGFRVLNVVGDANRECRAAMPGASISPHRAHQQCRARMVQRDRSGLALPRPKQADVDRLRREL